MTDGEGREWKVRRHWAPRWEGKGPRARLRKRWRRRDADAPDIGGLDIVPDVDGAVAIVVGIVALIAIVLLLWFVAIPLLLALLDVVVILVLIVGGLVGRVLFRRPWTVEAARDDGTRREWQVVGWRASGEELRAIESDLRHGRTGSWQI